MSNYRVLLGSMCALTLGIATANASTVISCPSAGAIVSTSVSDGVYRWSSTNPDLWGYAKADPRATQLSKTAIAQDDSGSYHVLCSYTTQGAHDGYTVSDGVSYASCFFNNKQGIDIGQPIYWQSTPNFEDTAYDHARGCFGPDCAVSCAL